MEYPITREAYERLRQQLNYLQNVELPAVVERLRAARGFGDLSENAEYDAAREEYQRLQERIATMTERLQRCRIVEPHEIPQDRVAFGAKVRVYDMLFEEEICYQFVSPGEEDYLENKILITSPLGQALVGKRVGDVVEFQAPAGLRRLKILEISYDF
jgi:transcription elongation factor GreA